MKIRTLRAISTIPQDLESARQYSPKVPCAAVIALLATCLVMTQGVLAYGKHRSRHNVFPETIPLPNGFHPEGIAFGRGPTFYAGSLVDGEILEGNARTGETETLVPGQEGRIAVGLKYAARNNTVIVAGGPTGQAYAYDAYTGDTLAVVQLTDAPATLINDLVIEGNTVWFTDSFRPVLYKVRLDRYYGLRDRVTEIPLGGDFVFDPAGINTNGIVAAGRYYRKKLIVSHFDRGELYRVNPRTGHATLIDVGVNLPNADGLIIRGRRLWVVQGINQVSLIKLDRDFAGGRLKDVITSDLFRVPATGAKFGRSLYVVNARLDVALPPFLSGEPPRFDVDFEIVRVPARNRRRW